MRLASLAAAACAVLLAAPMTRAADQPLLGNQFQTKDPSTPDKRKVQVKAREKASPNTIVGNPVTNGANLTIRANGNTPTQQVFNLPQGIKANGKPYWTGDAIKGFKYNDGKSEQGPVKTVQLKKSGNGTFTLNAQATGKVLPVNVTPPNIGTDACALLQIGGGGDSYSVQFAAGNGTIVNKTTKEYTHKKVTTQGTCVPLPTCSDGIQNQSETDIDCGGPNCAPCGPGGGCVDSSDCTSNNCQAGVCQPVSCSDGIENGDETDIDCGGSCPGDCAFNQGCVLDTDCQTAHCSGGLCKCENHLYTFTINSNAGGVFDSAEWPGGTTNQSAAPGCSVTINRPSGNIDLVGVLGDAFSINNDGNYSSCFGSMGEDGDGCQPVSCPPLGIGSCQSTRPSCSAALNGSGSAQYIVQCLE